MVAETNRTPDLTIDLTRVSKTYRGGVRALSDASIQVHPGEIFGLLGPNGAGKSTLVKILMTIVRPSRCEGTMLGAPVGHKPALARVGYLPEHLRFPEYLTGGETLDYLGALARVPARVRRRRADELLDLVGMTAWRNKKVGSYSKGMRQRLGVAQALMNDPDLVVLDEPTDGVDPVGRREIRNAMLEMKARGKTVLINSHLLGEVEMVCDRVSMLVQGVVARQGTLDELTHGGRRYEIEFDTTEAASHEALLQGVAERIDAEADEAAEERDVWRGRLPTGEAVERSGGLIRIIATDPAAVQPVIDALRRRDVVIRTVRPVRPTLEDLFIEAVTDPVTGETIKPGADGKRRRRAKKGGA